MNKLYGNRLLLFICLLVWTCILKGQKSRNLILFAGPSLTNVQQIVNGEKLFFTSPERPFYSIQYHFGLAIEEKIFSKEDLEVSYGLSFDQRASSNTRFNKYIEESYGFLALPLLIKYKPLKDHEIWFELGTDFLYLVYNSKYADVKAFTNFEIDYSIGIRFLVWNNMHLNTRFLEPLRIMRGKSDFVNIDPNIPNEIILYKTHAIQISFIYKLDL
ncbi:MAG: hypothetical protein ABIO44_04390 [Saprospiraceae bacterium]